MFHSDRISGGYMLVFYVFNFINRWSNSTDTYVLSAHRKISKTTFLSCTYIFKTNGNEFCELHWNYARNRVLNTTLPIVTFKFVFVIKLEKSLSIPRNTLERNPLHLYIYYIYVVTFFFPLVHFISHSVRFIIGPII